MGWLPPQEHRIDNPNRQSANMTSFEMSPIRSVVSPEVDEEVREHRLSYVGGNQLGWPVNDPSHPRNWSSWVKAFNLFVIVSLEFTT